jgi:hypothetical protein
LIVRQHNATNNNFAVIVTGILMINETMNIDIQVKSKRISRIKPQHLRDIRQEHLNVTHKSEKTLEQMPI